jgi:uncharacterized membrane protein YfcA
MNPLAAGLGAGLCGGLLSGLFGLGGGIVMVPLLSVGLHLDQHRAQGATLAAMLLPIGLPAVLEYWKRGIRASLPLVGVLILTFLVGIYAGARVANLLSGTLLRWGFCLLLVGLALLTLTRKEPLPGAEQALGSEASGPGIWVGGAPIGFLGGLVSGLTGLGGAVVMVPLLASRFRLTQHAAQLTTLIMLLPPIGLPGVWVYAKAQGGLPWMAVAGVALGFAGGALLGARIATRLRGARLKQIYVGVILLLALLVAVGGR